MSCLRAIVLRLTLTVEASGLLLLLFNVHLHQMLF